MPSIRKSSVPRTQVESATIPATPSLNQPAPLPSPFGVSPFFKCSLPPLAAGLDQNARQFYGVAGNVPQQRLMPAQEQQQPPRRGTGGAAGAAGAAGAPGKDSAANRRIEIPLHVTAIQQTGTVPLGRSFLLKQISTTAACRVRLYSAASFRAADLARDIATPLLINAQHGCIADWEFDATFVYPLVWVCSPAFEGGDESAYPAGDIAYTVDNYGSLTGSGWAGQLVSSRAFFGGMEVARAAAVTPGTLVRYTTAGAAPSTGYSYFFEDAGGALLRMLYVSPMDDFGPIVTNQVLVPAGAVNLVAYSGIGGYWGGALTDFGHYSNVWALAMDKAASFAVDPLDLQITVVKQER